MRWSQSGERSLTSHGRGCSTTPSPRLRFGCRWVAKVTFVGAGQQLPQRRGRRMVRGRPRMSSDRLSSWRETPPLCPSMSRGSTPSYCTLHGNAEGEGMAGRLLVGDIRASSAAQGVAETNAPREWSGDTVRVPEDFETIQAAVDSAAPGDMVLIGAGRYDEGIEVEHAGFDPARRSIAMPSSSMAGALRRTSSGSMQMAWLSKT